MTLGRLRRAYHGRALLAAAVALLISATAWADPPAAAEPAKPAAAAVPDDQNPAARVWSIALSPDGKKLVAGVEGINDGPAQLILWELDSKKELFRVTEPRRSRGVAFSPNGKLIVTGGFGTVARIFGTADGRVRRPLVGHKAGINAVTYSPDGKTIATGSWDKTVKLWDASTGKARATLVGHTDRVYGLAYAPDGKTVASCGVDGSARIWDASTGTEKFVLTGHDGVVESLTYAPDSRTLVTAGWDGTLRLWDVATGRPKAELEGSSEQLAVAYSPDGKVIASTGAPTGEPAKGLTAPLLLWDAATLKPLAAIPAHADRSYFVLFTPDGKTVVTSSMDRTVKFWDVASRKLIDTLTTARKTEAVPQQ